MKTEKQHNAQFDGHAESKKYTSEDFSKSIPNAKWVVVQKPQPSFIGAVKLRLCGFLCRLDGHPKSPKDRLVWKQEGNAKRLYSVCQRCGEEVDTGHSIREFLMPATFTHTFERKGEPSCGLIRAKINPIMD